ncbi:MAG TPA: DinB family protein [Phycisphaerales bacterium]|nr:DinB family protein [Phycisphaerales bacterium]
MEFSLVHGAAVLERTPGVLRALLDGLGPEWTHGNYGEGTFSPYDVVGHLITGERTDWLVRARIILERGTTTPFAKYDRYAQFEQSRGRSIHDLLDEFARLRAENLAALRALALTPADLAKRGMHPALGEVTLSQLLATWVVHDLNHLAQIARGMAWQYEGAVGPWREYLGIYKASVTTMDEDGARRQQASRGTA